MVFCANCGLEIEESDIFCPKCGQPNASAPPAKKIDVEEENLIDSYQEPISPSTTISNRSNIRNSYSPNNFLLGIPYWVQKSLQIQLFREESVQNYVVFANYPFRMRKGFVAVTQTRLVGISKTWVSTKQIDIPLRDISGFQLDTTFKIANLFWFLISFLLIYYLIGIPLIIYNFYRMTEKKLSIAILGIGTVIFEGRQYKLEIILRIIREGQFSNQRRI